MNKPNFKVLILLVMYLLVSTTSLFFTPASNSISEHQSSIRQKIEHFIQFQRISRTAVNENEYSIHRILQNATLFFTILLFNTILLTESAKRVMQPSLFFTDHRYRYLDYRVIRI